MQLSRVRVPVGVVMTKQNSHNIQIVQSIATNIYEVQNLGYFFTSDSFDRQVDHRICRLIRVAVNFWGGEVWVLACHHCRDFSDDEDAQSLAKVTHHLVLVLAKVPRQLPPQPGDGLQAHLVPAAKGVNSQGEEGDGFGAAPRLVLAQLLLVGVGNSRVPLFRGSHH